MLVKKIISGEKERKRNAFLIMSLVVSFSIVIFSFEWGERGYVNAFSTSTLNNKACYKENSAMQLTSLEKYVITKKGAEVNDTEEEIKSTDVVESFSIYNNQETACNDPYIIVDEMPEFPGGDEGRIEFFANNIKCPDLARQNRVEGTVYIQFVIGTDGSVKDVALARGIGSGCDEEAIRIAKMMPKWKPGKQGNKLVNVLCTIPINFQLSK
ncbi:MAG: energy transducer TonB [Bacteroidota bacterium]